MAKRAGYQVVGLPNYIVWVCCRPYIRPDTWVLGPILTLLCDIARRHRRKARQRSLAVFSNNMKRTTRTPSKDEKLDGQKTNVLDKVLRVVITDTVIEAKKTPITTFPNRGQPKSSLSASGQHMYDERASGQGHREKVETLLVHDFLSSPF